MRVDWTREMLDCGLMACTAMDGAKEMDREAAEVDVEVDVRYSQVR